jgi:hypothetical protein
LLGQRGIDVGMRWHQRRQVDLHRGRRWGREDHVVPWTKPVRPAWMDEATSAVFPDPSERRERRVQVTQPGFRTRVVLVATTLVEAQACAKEALAALYRARWHAELDGRASKQTMPMDVLRCQTPAMVHKEIWGHLLVSNLIRATMAQAALRHGVLPRHVRLQGARQTLAAFGSALAQASSTRREGVLSIVLTAMASHRVGTRPNRYEPRACKRRPKSYPLLRVPRQQARARLAQAA